MQELANFFRLARRSADSGERSCCTSVRVQLHIKCSLASDRTMRHHGGDSRALCTCAESQNIVSQSWRAWGGWPTAMTPVVRPESINLAIISLLPSIHIRPFYIFKWSSVPLISEQSTMMNSIWTGKRVRQGERKKRIYALGQYRPRWAGPYSGSRADYRLLQTPLIFPFNPKGYILAT